MVSATLKESGLRGMLVRPLTRPNQTYPPGRVCAAEGMPDAAFHLQPLGPLLAARAQACLCAACSKDQEMKAKPVQKPSPEKKRSRSLRCNHWAGEGEAQ